MTEASPVRVERAAPSREPAFLLVGPYDPSCGEYTFLSPPLGVWRLAGVLAAAGIRVRVLDPNACDGPAERALERELAAQSFDLIGFSTTGMTLRFDLALAHLARSLRPTALLVAGGMEATFDPAKMFRLGPFDLVALGEGERPLAEIARRLRAGQDLRGIAGTARPVAGGGLERLPQRALGREELRDAIFLTPYEQMPYRRYWERLEACYRVGALPFKADREARLAEIRSVRLITLNYCPMGCTFCSSTNFLGAAQEGTARIGRLEPAECMAMIERIAAGFPDVRTVIFQDDIFAFPTDRRILPLCDAILAAKAEGRIPAGLQFISTNRIDAMTPERLRRMRLAGFRVLGFGVESFSPGVLREFNKARIHPHIEPILRAALEVGITPFLDLILTSPRSTLGDLGENVRQAHRWIRAGCEVGMYPYVIPFTGSAMAADPALRPQTVHELHRVAGTAVRFEQATKILPFDPLVREAILEIEAEVEARLDLLEQRVAHLPSRVRSLLWIACAIPVLERLGEPGPAREAALDDLLARLPGHGAGKREELRPSWEARAPEAAQVGR